MGSIQSIKTSEYGGRQSGKIDASLNEKLNSIEWGEYKVEDLFDLLKIPYLLSKEQCERNGIYPVYSSESNNGGIIGYTNEALFICNETNPIYVIFGDHTRTLNIVNKSFSVLDNVKVLRPKIENYKILLFILSSWKKQIPNLGYARHWKAARNIRIELPIQKGKIDFKFMESFIAELEAQRIAELEAYLTLTGLKNTNLSLEEEQVLSNLEKIEWKEFNLTDIFTVKNTRSILSRDIVENSGTIPYLCASAENNAVSSYISYDDEYMDKGNCIFIGGKTFVVTYQENDFFSNDSHNLSLYLKNVDKCKKQIYLYLVTCVYKSLNHKYSWGNSISNKKIQNDIVCLPMKDNKIDYECMEFLISAVQKLVIRDVVAYSDRKIKVTKDVIKKTS